MSFDMALTDKLGIFVEDMRRGEVECLPPDINASHAYFTVEDGAARYALGALKGVGEKAMEALVEEREKGGAFQSLEDLAGRIDPRLLNRRQLESLAGAGAFDSIKPERPAVFAAAETILAHATSAHDQRTSGQAALFGANPAEAAPIRLPRDASWTSRSAWPPSGRPSASTSPTPWTLPGICWRPASDLRRHRRDAHRGGRGSARAWPGCRGSALAHFREGPPR